MRRHVALSFGTRGIIMFCILYCVMQRYTHFSSLISPIRFLFSDYFLNSGGLVDWAKYPHML